LKKAQAMVQMTSGKEYNVNCFGIFFFSASLMDVMGGKITMNLKELH
jgi:hypothetical protein